MTEATEPSPPDPTLASLVPRSSARRNRALLGVALVLLVAVWVSPYVLRPSVATEDGGGSWSPLPPHPEVVTSVDVEPKAWVDFSIESVGDVPGATATSAWLVPNAVWPDDTDPAEFGSGLEFLLAGAFGDNLSAHNQLPQRADRSQRSRLVILWEIADCSKLVDELAPDVQLRSILHIPSHQQLGAPAAPGSHYETLAEVGICPAR